MGANFYARFDFLQKKFILDDFPYTEIPMRPQPRLDE